MAFQRISLFKYPYALLMSMSKHLSRKGIYSFLREELAELRKGERVLIVGAGGPIHALVRDCSRMSGLIAVTVDIDEKTQPDILGDVCHHDFGNMRFNAIVMGEVLEHLHSPHMAIDNLREILVPGGRLIITAPFIFPIHQRPRDYYRYTRFGLQYLLRDFGEISIKERNDWGESINVLLARLIREKGAVARLFAPFFVLYAFFTTPIMVLFSKLVKTDSMTSGYLVTARLTSLKD